MSELDGETVAQAAIAAVRLGTLVVVDMVEELEPIEIGGITIDLVPRKHQTLTIAEGEPILISDATTSSIIARLGGFTNTPLNFKVTDKWLKAKIGFVPENGSHVRNVPSEKARNKPPTLADLFGE